MAANPSGAGIKSIISEAAEQRIAVVLNSRTGYERLILWIGWKEGSINAAPQRNR